MILMNNDMYCRIGNEGRGRRKRPHPSASPPPPLQQVFSHRHVAAGEAEAGGGGACAARVPGRSGPHAHSYLTRTSLTAFLILCIIITTLATIPVSARIRASGPYKVMLTTGNFSQSLQAAATDLSDPSRALFYLQNGTPLWYSISVQSTPAGITPVAADSSDLFTTTYYGASPLLPPANILPPTLSQDGTGKEASLKLALAFTAPGEQAQITLNPFEAHATLMDALELLLHLLGENSDGLQIGLLAPGEMQAIFTASSSMQYLQSFAGDYQSLLQSVASNSNSGSNGQNTLFQPAYACASDLVALVSDTTERAQLADMLWRLLGKTINPADIAQTLATFGQAQFGLGILGYLKDNALAVGSALFQQNNPVVTIRSVANVTPTPTVITPPLITPTPTVVVTPRITPTARPTNKP